MRNKISRSCIGTRDGKGERGLLFLLVIACIVFLSPSMGQAVCECMFCHGEMHGEGWKGCAACHGNPPVADTVGGPNGLVGYPSVTGSTKAGAHAKHATADGYDYSCATCHSNGMPATPMAGNEKVQIGFNIMGAGGGSYDGHLLNPPYTYEATNGSVITSGGSLTCSNIYCHSDGTAVSTGVLRGNASPAWDSSGPLACNTCHGYPPLYSQDQPKSNSHSVHRLFQCNTCHLDTTADGAQITGILRHVDGFYDVKYDPSVLYLGNPVPFTYEYDPGGGRCSNVACHGPLPNHKNWGGVELAAAISWSQGAGCNEVRLSGLLNGTPPQTFYWDLGDGQIAAGQNIVYFYNAPGDYLVSLDAIDAYNHPASSSTTVTARQINTSPIPGKSISVSGMTVTITDLSTDPDYNQCGHSGAGMIQIDWRDGAVTSEPIDLNGAPSGRVFTHTYASSGTYSIIHNVRDNAGSPWISSGSAQVTVPTSFTVRGRITHSGGSGYTAGSPFGGVSVRLETLSGTVVKLTTTDSQGNYSLNNIGQTQCYLVRPVKTGFTFTPPVSQQVCTGTDNVDFVGTP